ncbi:MAG: S41 family peptidase [Caldilineales bacterium]
MQAHAVYRNEMDWPAFRARVTNVGRNAKSLADAHQVIQLALMWIDDPHTHFMTPSQFEDYTTRISRNPGPPPEARLIEGQFGYLLLPAFSALDAETANQFASSVQALIRAVDAGSPCGWVVDLTTNTGGSSGPMQAGVGPILGEGVVGAFVDPDGETYTWSYAAGQALVDDKVLTTASEPYELSHPAPPVAVLTSRRTASAGETVVVAFRGRPDTHSFGQPTGGLTTGVASREMSDGGMLLLAEVYFADRAGVVYDGPIAPDEVVDDGDPDAVLRLR